MRGVVVQYIPPAGSVVGSLSVRVVRVSARGRQLVGELVTVAIVSPHLQNLAEGSVCTLTLRAQSPGSIMKGQASVRKVVSTDAVPAPPSESPASLPSAPAPAPGNGQAGDHGPPSPPQGGNAGGAPAANQNGDGNGQGGGDHDSSPPAPPGQSAPPGPSSPPGQSKGPHG